MIIIDDYKTNYESNNTTAQQTNLATTNIDINIFFLQ